VIGVEQVDFVTVPTRDVSRAVAFYRDVQGAACAEFVAGGGELSGIEDTGVCHMGFVKDPDGNVLILHRRYAPKVRRDEG
jgi:catechol 2,3-dioxygenase-like lactoylglutathione lyase family enzyme